MEPAEVFGSTLKSSEKLVLLYVLLESGSAHSYQEIAQACSLSPGHVKRILQGLRQQGWVQETHRPGKACTWTLAGTPAPPPPQAPVLEPPARPATAQGVLDSILEYYRQKFRAVTGKMPFLRRRDTQTLQEMLQTFGAEHLRALLDAYFDSKDPFIVNSGWAVGVLASRANSLLMARDPKKPEQKRERYEHLYQN